MHRRMMLPRLPRRVLPLVVLLTAWLCATITLPRATAAALADPAASVVTVPTGVTTVVLGDDVTQWITCRVLPSTVVRIELALTDGNGTNANALVVPRVVVFVNANATSTDATTQAQQFTLYGRRGGRFYLTYTLSGDTDKYVLSAASSVITITEASQGWQGIWYEVAFNLAIFAAGLAFFVWRRIHRVELPIWREHRAGLFERVNYDDVDLTVFNQLYSAIHGDTFAARVRRFVAIRAKDAFVCDTCGIPAALNLQFHVDAGHLFAALSVVSLAVVLPVNYVSGRSQQGAGDSFQQTTFSNVPLNSNWYWVHVAYCYVVAAAVLTFILRQSRLASTLQNRTKRIVGARSLLIHHGLPASMTSRTLRTILATYLSPTAIDEVTVIDDLTQVHAILHRRRALADELERMRQLDANYEDGTLSWNLLLCPGSVLLPSPTEVVSSLVCCKPCRYAWRHETLSDLICPAFPQRSPHPRRLRPSYSRVKSDREIFDPRARSAIASLDEELDFFPEDALRVYHTRRCMGAAFIVFATPAARNAFVRFVFAHSVVGRVRNAIDNCTWQARSHIDAVITDDDDRTTTTAGSDQAPATEQARLVGSYRSSTSSSSSSAGADSDAVVTASDLAPYLSKLVLESAPEPDDIIWENLKYRPYTLPGCLAFCTRQVITITLLLLFSTPTAVLVYVKLDASSDMYKTLAAHHTFAVTLLVSYLPSLLLIIVNWFLLASLYYMTMTEPSFSESRRTTIFLVKGFIYLVLSSVILPSIGVTAVFLAVSGIGKTGSSEYVESFLYKVSGTFFISYILQRTFLGAILDLTRSAERLVYQPWVLARSVTADEQRQNHKPWPFFYGHDYALVLSVFMMILLGTVMTPIITPFGALYFYLKATTNKYNFLYVLPFSPGRGHVAQTAVTLAFACLVLFEFVMAFVVLQVAGRRHFAAMIVLLVLTTAFYVLRVSGVAAAVTRTIVDRRLAATKHKLGQQQPQQREGRAGSSVYSSPSRPIARHETMTSTLSSTLSTASSGSTVSNTKGTRATYADPFKVGLSLFKLLGVNQFHRMTSRRTQLIYAFYRLRRHAQLVAAAERLSLPMPMPLAHHDEDMDASNSNRDDRDDGRGEETQALV